MYRKAYVHMSAGIHGDQKCWTSWNWITDGCESNLVWTLETKLESSVCSFHCWAMAAAPSLYLFLCSDREQTQDLIHTD